MVFLKEFFEKVEFEKIKTTKKHVQNPRMQGVIIYEPVHEIFNNVVCAISKASDQPAHMRSLIRAFASRLSILWLLSYGLNTIWSF